MSLKAYNSGKVAVLLVIGVIIAVLSSSALADIYMHNPRGSNTRNCERNNNRNNANLIFDSQNNAAGGYACPRKVGGPSVKTPDMYYYEGSELKVEWTSQHSCGKGNNDCVTVLQYMCNDTKVGEHEDYGEYYAVRYGVPNNDDDSATDRVNENTKYDLRYSVHEQYDYYRKCDIRNRNKGLYISDRNVRNDARGTRQSPNGDRHGFECPEERDYYPYWHWSPWIDIAVFTGNTTRCEWYKEESQNVKPRGECWRTEEGERLEYLEYNNERECNSNDGTWIETPAWDIDPPECLSTDLIEVRDNHLGNTDDGYTPTYNWKIPYVSGRGRDRDSGNVVPVQTDYTGTAKVHHKNCVLRIRYNISTSETPWDLDSANNGESMDYDNEGGNPIIQDPWNNWGYDHHIQLAANTNQYGRVFQDRSYVFEIRERPEDVPMWAKIHNLNVRGKRGNIVQVYPAVEYDFVPNHLDVDGDDYVHIQWAGSEYNPDRTPNNAEGGPVDPANPNDYRSDRSNIIQLDEHGDNLPRSLDHHTMFLNEDGEVDKELANRVAFMDQDINDDTICHTKEKLIEDNTDENGNVDEDDIELSNYNCGKIGSNSIGPYFDAGLVKMRANGKFYYMSSRNNNFSNRGQKGSITVRGAKFSSASSIGLSTMCLMIVIGMLLNLLM